MSQPDLFVVCKNCGSEVSPYVTECPYCGQRVRKRAPKIDRPGNEPDEPPKRRVRLSRLRSNEIEGIAPDTRPYATGLLVLISLVATLVLAVDSISAVDLGAIFVPVDDQPWRIAAAPFVHESLGYQFVALVAVGLFGSMLERRFGWFPVLLTFLAAGAIGAEAAILAGIGSPFEDDALIRAITGVDYTVMGANGAALGLLAAWLVDDRRAARRGDDRENDLIGVYVFAAVLLLLPLAVAQANPVAGVAGVATGALLGLILPVFTRR